MSDPNGDYLRWLRFWLFMKQATEWSAEDEIELERRANAEIMRDLRKELGP
jgi:hypothetical protein